ncbi:MAG: SBBP repeat-containing protein [Chloroflexota bacterium]
MPGRVPFPIEQNVGQAGEDVSYLLRAGAMQVNFGTGELSYALSDAGEFAHAETMGRRPGEAGRSLANVSGRSWTVRQELVGASKAVPSGTVGSPTAVSYFKGHADQWLVGVPAFEQVTYAEAWPGITVTFARGVDGPKSAYEVAAGADPGQIRLLYTNARVHVDELGVLVAETPLGELRESPPVAWQERDGTRTLVQARYELLTEPGADETEYGFALGAYDPGLPLVIDPQITYASYVGGSGRDWGRAVAVDGAGNVYMTGMIEAPGTLPSASATFDNSHNGNLDAFVVKMNPAGTGLLYASFIGGSGDDSGFGIAIDAAGSAYISGLTVSTEATFPAGSGLGALATFDGTFNGGSGIEFGGDAFVAKVNPAGTALVYASYIGGSGDDTSNGIAVDAQGNAYVTGLASAPISTLPDGGGPGGLTTFDGSFNGGGGDAFVVKVNPAGTALVYGAYIGGSGFDQAYGIAVDAAGNAYVTGRAESSEATFPNGSGMASFTSFDPTHNGGTGDAFVAKVNAAGTALAYVGFVGGNGYDYAYSVAVDAQGSAYVTGPAGSNEATFPNGNGMGSFTTFDNTYNGGDEDGFVVKVNPAGTGLLYASYIGGSGVDVGVGVAVDGSGHAYVTGGTTSMEGTFPTGTGMGALKNNVGVVPTFHGTTTVNQDGTFEDGFLVRVNAAGTALDYAGFLGGNGIDSSPPFSTETGVGVAVDAAGNAYVTGRTNSNEGTFPDGLGMTLPTFDNTYGGGLADAFVVRVTPGGTCSLTARQAAAGLTYANAAYQYAYYDYITSGSTNSYYALVYEYQAYLNSQTARNALRSGDYTTAKANFSDAATYALYGYQYAYVAYAATGSQYAFYAFAYGYYASAYEAEAYANC